LLPVYVVPNGAQNEDVKKEPSPRSEERRRQRTFAERFCDKFTCDPGSFESRALLASLDPVPRLFARLICTLNPGALETDRKILRRVSQMETVPDVMRAVQDIEKEYVAREDFGPMRRLLKVRLSRERLLKVTARIWDRPPNYALVVRA
jgi:hypothetical protein